jgi:hypothetical protein
MNLSREALALLELLPMWELRPQLAAGATASAVEADAGTGLMIVGLVGSADEQALWMSMARAMRAMGFPAESLDTARMLASPQDDLWSRHALAQRPAHVLAFGQVAAETLSACWPSALGYRAHVHAQPALADMLADSKVKAAVWPALVELRGALRSALHQ